MRVAQLQSSWRVFELWNTDTGVKPKRGYIRGTPYVPFGTFGQTKVHIFQHITLRAIKIGGLTLVILVIVPLIFFC